jgi:protein-S-isoprenylcysteine O-methyltransferase Ste14
VRGPRPPTDLRRQRNELTRRLLWLVLFVLVVVGGILIAVVYGAQAAALGVSCLLVGAGVIGLLWAIFTLIERWVG